MPLSRSTLVVCACVCSEEICNRGCGVARVGVSAESCSYVALFHRSRGGSCPSLPTFLPSLPTYLSLLVFGYPCVELSQLGAVLQ